MQILIFHGYLLRGTGSNEYVAALARTFAARGHAVALLCQERHADELEFVDAVGRFDGARLTLETLREPVRVTAYLPDIGRTLPVYVADRYEGFDAVSFRDLGDDGLATYLEANVAAVKTVARRFPPDAALANHLVMGPVILARGLGGGYAVKIHGSALEYTVRPQPERFLTFAREGLASAAAVLVGSRHTARRLLDVVPDAELGEKVRLGPPGVDVEAFRPREPAAARAELGRLAGPARALSGALGGRAERAGGPARPRPATRADRQLRRQADRLQGR